MAQVEKTARIWFYSRDLDFFASLCKSSSQESSTGGPTALKHWAVILDYMSIKDPSQVNKRILYEANEDGGLLVANEVVHGEDEEDQWKQSPGFDHEDHGTVTINEARAKSYCENFNKLKIEYVATKDNCQRFVTEFIANVLPDSAISLPTTIKEAKSWFGSASSLPLSYVVNTGSAGLFKDFLIKSRTGEGALEMMLKEAIQMINLTGCEKISLLTKSPLKEYMAQEGRQLILTASGEMTENMLNASRGAFSWFNLLQIPVEWIVSKLMKSTGFTDLEAYGGKKLASCLTAAGVGVLAGGAVGCLGSVAFWIASEIVATISNCLFNKIFGKSIIGESDTLELIKSIYRYFEMKMTGKLNSGLEWMLDYIKSTQNRQKKLA